MNIDYAFILSAGMGSRMGVVGEVLPKPLWPVFEKTLLELQIFYVAQLGIQKILINSHHQHERMERFLEDLSIEGVRIELIYEENLLGVGGAIHNFSRHPMVKEKGRALVINSDQFLFFNERFWKEGLSFLESSPVCLYGIQVQDGSGYNETLVEGGFLQAIVQKTQQKAFYDTYSGVSLLDLEKIPSVKGASAFFETVACFKEKKIKFISLQDYEYWDFGTLGRYRDSLKQLLQKVSRKEECSLYEKLRSSDFLDLKKIVHSNKSYACFEGRCILNFSTEPSLKIEPSTEDVIFLGPKGPTRELESHKIYFEDKEDKLP